MNTYLNAITEGDQAFGLIMETLERHGPLTNLVAVVIGDHGEAFGEHGQVLHSFNLFEENVHVPCVLINPELFHGERLGRIGGLYDVPSTVLDVLGVDVPSGWQGATLFGSDARSTIFFHTSFGNRILFGCRSGNLKYIYDLSRK